MLQAPIEERVLPALAFAVIVALLLLGWSAMKKNTAGIAAGALLVIGVIFAYFRYLSPYSTDMATALGGKTVLFNIGSYGFTTGALGAIIVLIVVIVLMAWYVRRNRRT
jgi:hypothetical protein